MQAEFADHPKFNENCFRTEELLAPGQSEVFLLLEKGLCWVLGFLFQHAYKPGNPTSLAR